MRIVSAQNHRQYFLGRPNLGPIRHHPNFSDTSLALSVSGGADDANIDGEATNHESSTSIISDDALRGRVLLGLVALLYGTLNVSLRLIYQLPSDVAPSAAALSTARGWMATAGFVPLFLLGQRQPAKMAGEERNDTFETKKQETSDIQSVTTPSFFWAGSELAIWNFLAQGLLTVGLLSTSSARASFLTQTSVILTPIISRVFGEKVPPNVWVAASLALLGLTVLAGLGGPATTSTTAASTSILASFNAGDCLVIWEEPYLGPCTYLGYPGLVRSLTR